MTITQESFKELAHDILSRSEETYFGRNSPLSVELFEAFQRCRDQYQFAKKAGKVDKALAESLKDSLTAIEHCVERNLNIERCVIGIDNRINASSFPMAIDYNIKKDPKDPKKLNQALVKKIDDIIETKNGFRFRSKNGISIIIIFSLKFFDDPFTIEEAIAIFLHEVGHGMQHVIHGVNNDLIYLYLRASLEKHSMVVLLTRAIVTALLSTIAASGALVATGKVDPTDKETVEIFGYALISLLFMGVLTISSVADNPGESTTNVKNLMHKLKNGTLTEKEQTELVKAIYAVIESKYSDRDKIIKEIQDTTKLETLISAINTSKKSQALLKVFAFIANTITGFLVIFATPFNWISRLFLIKQEKEIKELAKKITFVEEFADAFATFYGFGPNVGSGLQKMRKLSGESPTNDLGAFNIINYVPLLNLAIHYNSMKDVRLSYMVHGYPESIEARVANTYKQLEYELANNKTLSAADIADIRASMEDAKRTYDLITDKNKIGNVAYKAFKKTMGEKDIDHEPTRVITNVIETLANEENIATIITTKNPEKDLADLEAAAKTLKTA